MTVRGNNSNMYLQYLMFETNMRGTEAADCFSVLENKFLSTLVKLNMYLETPLPYELDKNPNSTESSRLYLDGDTLSLADCNLLPKLNIVKVRRVQSEHTDNRIEKQYRGIILDLVFVLFLQKNADIFLFSILY